MTPLFLNTQVILRLAYPTQIEFLDEQWTFGFRYNPHFIMVATTKFHGDFEEILCVSYYF